MGKTFAAWRKRVSSEGRPPAHSHFRCGHWSIASCASSGIACSPWNIFVASGKLSSFRKLRPIGSEPKPRVSIDRSQGALGVPPALFCFAAIFVCV
jgi:hypothetical protein